ncbi:hypothetical protein Leryth_010939 [Lithospermum erythrorhizon]|nr:hypothetical protein Leryth_010939 [Lithospermum erythrorhizon]
MDLLRYPKLRFSTSHPHSPYRAPHPPRFFSIRSTLTLPFKKEKAKYYKELEALMLSTK